MTMIMITSRTKKECSFARARTRSRALHCRTRCFGRGRFHPLIVDVEMEDAQRTTSNETRQPHADRGQRAHDSTPSILGVQSSPTVAPGRAATNGARHRAATLQSLAKWAARAGGD